MILLILLVLTSIHWTQQHLTYPINYCHLAVACVHDKRMVCATTEDGCSRRTFLDQCDMYEYNCDFGQHYQETYTLYCLGSGLDIMNQSPQSTPHPPFIPLTLPPHFPLPIPITVHTEPVSLFETSSYPQEHAYLLGPLPILLPYPYQLIQCFSGTDKTTKIPKTKMKKKKSTTNTFKPVDIKTTTTSKITSTMPPPLTIRVPPQSKTTILPPTSTHSITSSKTSSRTTTTAQLPTRLRPQPSTTPPTLPPIPNSSLLPSPSPPKSSTLPPPTLTLASPPPPPTSTALSPPTLTLLSRPPPPISSPPPPSPPSPPQSSSQPTSIPSSPPSLPHSTSVPSSEELSLELSWEPYYPNPRSELSQEQINEIHSEENNFKNSSQEYTIPMKNSETPTRFPVLETDTNNYSLCCERPKTWETTTESLKLLNTTTPRTTTSRTTTSRTTTSRTTTSRTTTPRTTTSIKATTKKLDPTSTTPKKKTKSTTFITTTEELTTRKQTESTLIIALDTTKPTSIPPVISEKMFQTTELATFIDTETTWWYPTTCQNRNCERPHTWLTTTKRRRRYFGHHE